jgi:transcriptional regulator with XRE-family HTH domain
MDQDQAKSLGQLLRRRRRELGLSQRKLAALAHMSDSSIARLEHGRFSAPRPAKLSMLATALNLSRADIFVHAGYFVPEELPSFATYLKAKYPELSAKTQSQLVRYFQVLTGISPDMVTVNAEAEREGTLDSGIDRPTA